MTDQRPPDPNQDREKMTWQRPEDGLPVYGADAGATPHDVLRQQPPPAEGPAELDRPSYGPAGQEPYDIPPPGAPPLFGAAKTPDEMARQNPGGYAPPPPANYGTPAPSPQREPWAAPPPPPQQQWNAQQDWQNQQPNYQAPYGQQQYGDQPGVGGGQYPPSNYGPPGGGYPPQAYPGYAPVPPPPDNKMVYIAIGLISFSFILICCCPLFGTVMSFVGAAMANTEKNKARDRGERNHLAEVVFWFGIGLGVLNVIMFIVGIVNYIMNPNQVQDMMRDLGL